MPLHDIIFYDAGCGFCQRMIHFLLRRDRHQHFLFAPRPGRTFEKALDTSLRASLPPSLVVLTREGRVLVRSSAVLYIQTRLGGSHRLLARVLALIPVGIRDAGYALVAAVRHRLPMARVCGKTSPEHRLRFLD